MRGPPTTPDATAPKATPTSLATTTASSVGGAVALSVAVAEFGVVTARVRFHGSCACAPRAPVPTTKPANFNLVPDRPRRGSAPIS